MFELFCRDADLRRSQIHIERSELNLKKKTICLLFSSMLIMCSVTGCFDNKEKNSPKMGIEKAGEVALEYMNNKYDEDFYIVSSEEQKDHSIIPGKIIDSWIEVTVAIESDESDNEYFVHVRLNEDKVTSSRCEWLFCCN